jgi:autotransporter-associated beta strand protein
VAIGAGEIDFLNSATAGNETVFTNHGAGSDFDSPGVIQFFSTSTADHGTFINKGGQSEGAPGGWIAFFDSSTAGDGMFFDNRAMPDSGEPGTISFYDNSTAGTGTFNNRDGTITFSDSSTADSGSFISKGGYIYFVGSSTAGSGTFTNKATIFLYETSTAGNALFENNGYIDIRDTASGGKGTFINRGGSVSSDSGGLVVLGLYGYGKSSAGSATIINNGGAVTNASGGSTLFYYFSTAANSTLIANGGVNGGSPGSIQFLDRSIGSAARVEVFGDGNLNINGHDSPGVTIGSLEGTGIVFLGSNRLSVGNKNQSTIFSGIIRDAGALTKVGPGTLSLTGANNYTGGTIVEGGALLINNESGSGTGSGAVQVNAGRLGGRGTIAGSVTLGTGSGAGAILAPGKRVGKASALTMQGALTFNSDSTYNCGVKTRQAITDKVVADGVIINGAQFLLTGSGDVAIPQGTVFTVIDNTAPTPIAGTFSNLPDGSTFTARGNTFRANYEGGDGNDLTLTAE